MASDSEHELLNQAFHTANELDAVIARLDRFRGRAHALLEAVELLDSFDRYSQGCERYVGSPFQTQVRTFMEKWRA